MEEEATLYNRVGKRSSYVVELDEDEENEPHVADYIDQTGVRISRTRQRTTLRMADGSYQSFENRNIRRV